MYRKQFSTWLLLVWCCVLVISSAPQSRAAEAEEIDGGWPYAAMGLTQMGKRGQQVSLASRDVALKAENWALLYEAMCDGAEGIGDVERSGGFISVLNHLGSRGWRLMSHSTRDLADSSGPYGTHETWLFIKPLQAE